MIDRPARNELISAIHDYLDEKIMAFVFDARINGIKTEDVAIDKLVSILWFFYDDVKDHKVVLTQMEWNFFQRVLLFLQTNLDLKQCHLKIKKRKFSLTQILAGVTLIAQLILVFYLWNQGHKSLCWYIPAFLGGIVSAPVYLWRKELENRLLSKEEVEINDWIMQSYYPFSDIATMREAMVDTAFVKQSYPKHLENREIRTKGEIAAINQSSKTAMLFLNFIFSPIILLIQCFPVKTEVVARN